MKKDITKAAPTALPFASTGPALATADNTGPVLTMKTADKGKAIIHAPKVDVKSDNASEDPR